MIFQYYLETLIYLQSYEDDGEYHEIEHLFKNIEQVNMLEIIKELHKEELILIRGGYRPYVHLSINSIDKGGTRETKTLVSSLESKYLPFEAKITLKGILKLKTFQMKNEINITGNNNSVIQNSPYAFLQIQNQSEVIAKINEIIENLSVDNMITEENRQQSLIILNQLLEESKNGKPQRNTLDKVQNLLQTGDSLSSIGSLVVSLLSYFQ